MQILDTLYVGPAVVLLTDRQHGCSFAMQDAENNWHFDIFEFADATLGCSLSMLTLHVFKQSGLVKECGLDEAKLQAYLRKIEKGYDPNNPYHNR